MAEQGTKPEGFEIDGIAMVRVHYLSGYREEHRVATMTTSAVIDVLEADRHPVLGDTAIMLTRTGLRLRVVGYLIDVESAVEDAEAASASRKVA